MRIGGIVKTTLIDYPGKLASMVFTAGCNFRCPWCHNGGLVTDEPVIDQDEVMAFILSRKHLIDGVVVSGGEPTLQGDLEDFLKSIKELGLLVKLDTNGSLPDRLEKLLEKDLLDYVAMDVKAPLEDYPKVAGAEGYEREIRRSISLIMDSAPDYEFRTTFVPGLHDSTSARGIGQLVQGAKIHYLQYFRPIGNLLSEEYRHSRALTEGELKGYAGIIAPYVEEVKCRI
ncbi:anaerobic ribonucleoside-triphosphate reductase activating protein [Dethiosulfovibrio salsuginis]|uniref:Pyruvate formate lyase activating enzyme n=1 Tax=Dethiosulfovibrio salsuginis TaxID=561720 RepID=A0A1X7IXB5_9BACT|nr:anaerobic ribonucleoside-triphosphate reductase activating protein [Dethiosulfovibrio salsuginis]SMG19556.1 pyruvate formate lyase activating enzyme [Dethiosulfovibrio salsuginis]